MKYMGSKNRISKDIAKIINECIEQNEIDKYIEPFVGGGNVIDKIDNKILKIGLDKNKYLIALLNKAINDKTILDIRITKEHYTEIKNNTEKFEDWLVGYAGFLCSYNGKFFGGYANKTKTKIGTIRDYQTESRNNLKKQLNSLEDAYFYNQDYFTWDSKDKNVFIYCDPPYKNTTEYYNNNFNTENYLNKLKEISKINYVLCSEYEMPEDFICIWEKELATTLDKSSRKKATEKLFTHKEGLFYKWWINKELEK